MSMNDSLLFNFIESYPYEMIRLSFLLFNSVAARPVDTVLSYHFRKLLCPLSSV